MKSPDQPLYTVVANHEGMTVVYIVAAATEPEAVREVRRQAEAQGMATLRIDHVRPVGGVAESPGGAWGERRRNLSGEETDSRGTPHHHPVGQWAEMTPIPYANPIGGEENANRRGKTPTRGHYSRNPPPALAPVH